MAENEQNVHRLPGLSEDTQTCGLIIKKPKVKQNSAFNEGSGDASGDHVFKVPDVPSIPSTKKVSLLGLDTLAAKKRKLDADRADDSNSRRYRRYESPAPDTPSFPSDKSKEFRHDKYRSDSKRGLTSSTKKHHSSHKEDERRGDRRTVDASPWEKSGSETPRSYSQYENSTRRSGWEDNDDSGYGGSTSRNSRDSRHKSSWDTPSPAGLKEFFILNVD